MSMVTLVSGGLDSTVMSVLAKREGLTQHPLFIDYGQRGRDRELRACRANLRRHELPSPKLVALAGFGALLPSGLTDARKHVFSDAFLPCRNLMFLTVAAAYAYQRGASSVAIGLLDDAFSLFPDQTRSFISAAEDLLSRTLGKPLTLATPLISMSKAQVVRVAKTLGITQTYSCHSGTKTPCGDCVACREYIGLEV